MTEAKSNFYGALLNERVSNDVVALNDTIMHPFVSGHRTLACKLCIGLCRIVLRLFLPGSTLELQTELVSDHILHSLHVQSITLSSSTTKVCDESLKCLYGTMDNLWSILENGSVTPAWQIQLWRMDCERLKDTLMKL